MKKVTAILLLLIIMLTTTHVSEFLKLDKFIRHFTEHKATEPGMSLLDFFTLHYMNGDIRDEDYKKDMQLPFKEIANQCHHNITLNEPVTAIILKPCSQLITKKFRLINLAIPVNNYSNTVWQPPRV